MGSSTGGFTDCLLQHGAREVIAVDVGYGLLDYRLRQDPRVLVMERTNARELSPEMLPASPSGAAGLPDLAAVDVSFISLEKVLPALLGCLAEPFDVLALVKPQFELGRGRVPEGGWCATRDLRRETLVSVGDAALGLGLAVRGYHSSGLPGPKGNRETFVWLVPAGPARRPGRARGPCSRRWPARWSREGDHRPHPPAARGDRAHPASCWPSAPSEAGVRLRLSPRRARSTTSRRDPTSSATPPWSGTSPCAWCSAGTARS